MAFACVGATALNGGIGEEFSARWRKLRGVVNEVRQNLRRARRVD